MNEENLNQLTTIDKENLLIESIENVINYFFMEYDLTYTQVIGVLEIIKDDLLRDNLENCEG